MFKTIWFKSDNWISWRPGKWQGWIVTIIYILLALIVFRVIDVSSHPVSDTLIRMFISFAIISLIFVFICEKLTKIR